MRGEADCPICAKHRGEGELVGPVIYADQLIMITHRATGSLGYAFIETRRHVPYVDQLSDAEAASVGSARSRLAAALAAELAVEHVHAMVAGIGVAHVHEHVFVRHLGTPVRVGWDEPWADAPTGDIAPLVARLAERLRGLELGQ